MDFCAKVALLPLKREMREAIEDTNFDSRKEETKDKLFRAISKGPYMSQLRNAMRPQSYRAWKKRSGLQWRIM